MSKKKVKMKRDETGGVCRHIRDYSASGSSSLLNIPTYFRYLACFIRKKTLWNAMKNEQCVFENRDWGRGGKRKAGTLRALDPTKKIQAGR